MKKVYFTIYDMGRGHRSTANALRSVIEQRNLPWKVEIVEVFKEVFKTSLPQFIYNNLVMKKKWARVINDPFSVPLFKLQIRFRQAAWRNYLQQFWRDRQPDLVVSLLPLVNQVLYESLQADFPNTPFVTSMTDFADCPPHFWIEEQPQFLICPSEKAIAQAKALDYPEERLFETSGVVIQPRFSDRMTVDRASERKRLGLKPDLTTGLVICGAHGANEMMQIAERLEHSASELQLIFICGKNEQLAQTLRSRPSRLPKFVEGFTDRIPYYMSLCDFFIGKPGSVGISEAIAMGLPVITECNHLTLFQERASADWLTDKGFGIVIDNFSSVDKAVAELLDPLHFSTYKNRVDGYNNRAVFEVVDCLEEILALSSAGEGLYARSVA
jgi:1,2-diacylglycerol 3-beta-galactosyltransferase